jgi:hypothetical protein
MFNLFNRMEEILFSDIFSVITEYLIPKELYHLTKVCKRYQEIITLDNIKKCIFREMYRRLSDIFFNDTDEFISVLVKNNCVISGSFIIQCMLGECWDDSDINIHVKNKNEMMIDYYYEYFFKKRNLNVIKTTISESDFNDSIIDNGIVSYLYHKNYRTPGETHYKMNDIIFELYNTKINISLFTKKSISKHIMRYYSYDICKNICYFSCENFKPNNISIVVEMDDIFDKCIKFPIKHWNYQILKPICEKYIHRGFSFYFIKNGQKIIDNFRMLELLGWKLFYLKPIDQPKNIFIQLRSKKYEYYISDNIVFREPYINPNNIRIQMYTINDINIKDFIKIRLCDFNEKCVLRSLYPNKIHFHELYLPIIYVAQ